VAASTCEQQRAAAENAFTAEELEAGWDPATCGGVPNGWEATIRFAGDRLVILLDGGVAWDGQFAVVDEDTFTAGDRGEDHYLEYAFNLDGDTLTIDMLVDDYPASSPEELLGEQIAQTVIYESAPFTRAS
jgi:hypothetical protein